MPPKFKMHKSTGKSALHKPNEISENEPAFINDPEIQQQFEVELCWCIQQLQLALKSGKLNQKQVQDHRKSLNTLMSNSTPIVKKRQVMRLSFGDYRAKMQIEEKKSKDKNLKIKVVPAKPSSKSQFIKKSLFSTSTDNTFKFNFDTPKEDITEDVSNIKISCEEDKVPENLETKDFHFSTSDNNFRFNFNIERS